MIRVMFIFIMLFNIQASDAQIFGSFKDERDGKSYKTVKIDNQIWMAENLSYESPDSSWCYDDLAKNCKKNGRLYTWEIALKSCPCGWHLPSKLEFDTLLQQLPGDKYTSFVLNDSLKFAFLFSGSRYPDTYYSHLGGAGYLWTSTPSETNKSYAWLFISNRFYKSLKLSGWDKTWGFSVRCIKD